MSLTTSYPLNSTFAGVNQLQCMGNNVSGNSAPNGVAGSIEIINGAMKATVRQTDPQTNQGIRSEIAMTGVALGTENWFTGEFMISAADWTQNSGNMCIMQIHPADALNTAVDFSMFVQNLQLYLSVPLLDPPTQGANSTSIPIGDLQFDRWYKYCLHAIWLNTPYGFMEFFVDAMPYYRRANRGTAFNSDAPYFKCGIYDAPHNADFGTKAAYHRNVKLYTGNDGYEVVMGSTPQPRRVLAV